MSVLFARADDNILLGATITATVAPLTSYSLTTLALLKPATRVLWGVKTVTITFTLGSAKQGDVLVIPMHNLDPGASVLSLTNGAGFSQAITIAALGADGFPPTLAVDLTALSGTRLSDTWNLVIASNSVNVGLGGAIAIYGKRTLSRGIRFGFTVQRQRNQSVITNEYGTNYRQDYETQTRAVNCTAVSVGDDVSELEDFYAGCRGGVDPGFLWPQGFAGLPGSYFGDWQPQYAAQNLESSTAYDVALTFTERSKGKPF